MGITQDIAATEYEEFKSFLESASGITLGEGRQYLIKSRLTKLLRDQHIPSVAELLIAIRQNNAHKLRTLVVDAMTTNETSWFRDHSPFRILTDDVFPLWDANDKQHGRIWSAACSSGQEPYTISIALSEYLLSSTRSVLDSVEIVATDISTRILAEAKKAEYEYANLERGLSLDRQQKFFSSHEDHCLVSDEVSDRVTFRQQNLLLDYHDLGKFDAVFCRNVLIYFVAERKSEILNKMAQILNPGGFLFLGASETINGYSDAFEMVRSHAGIYYRLKDHS